MNEKQYKEFGAIVQQCDSGQYQRINVASQVRSDALKAAWEEHGELRELLREAVSLFGCDDECCDPEGCAREWLQGAQKVLE